MLRRAEDHTDMKDLVVAKPARHRVGGFASIAKRAADICQPAERRFADTSLRAFS
jgi:hypothetical protein